MNWSDCLQSPVNLVLDTNVLRDRDFIRWTQSSYRRGHLLTSVISYMEFKRQMYAKGKDFEVDNYLRKNGISIINLTPSMADAAARMMSERENVTCPTCHNIDWADTVIYSSIGNPPTLMVTKNIRDFPSDRVVTPKQAMEMFSRND